MRRPELDSILTTMLGSQEEVSDLLFTVNKPFQVESIGELIPVTTDPQIERLTPFQTEMIALNLINENRWHIEDLIRRGSCDSSYALSDKARFRVNVFSQRGHYAIVFENPLDGLGAHEQSLKRTFGKSSASKYVFDSQCTLWHIRSMFE